MAPMHTRSLGHARPSAGLEMTHRRRVRDAEDTYAAALAGGDPETIRVAMSDLDDARMRARLWAR